MGKSAYGGGGCHGLSGGPRRWQRRQEAALLPARPLPSFETRDGLGNLEVISASIHLMEVYARKYVYHMDVMCNSWVNMAGHVPTRAIMFEKDYYIKGNKRSDVYASLRFETSCLSNAALSALESQNPLPSLGVEVDDHLLTWP